VDYSTAEARFASTLPRVQPPVTDPVTDGSPGDAPDAGIPAIIAAAVNLGSLGQGLNLGIINGTVTIPGLGTPLDGSLDKDHPSVTFKGTVFLTDFLFSNPNGQEGALVVLRNDTQLMRLRLENFRDYDVHFVTPIVFGPGDQLGLSLRCESGGVCDPAVLYSGYLRP